MSFAELILDPTFRLIIFSIFVVIGVIIGWTLRANYPEREVKRALERTEQEKSTLARLYAHLRNQHDLREADFKRADNELKTLRVAAAQIREEKSTTTSNEQAYLARTEKAEANAAHDGRVIEGPIDAAVPGKAYQRLIDNEIAGGLVEDLRCCLVGGTPIVVFRKRRPLERRFLNENVQVLLDEPRNCYSPDEIRVIERFAAEIGLDWGGVDVLRDRMTGRIYIVDANKTDMGPPVALKLGSKLRATRRMASRSGSSG